ncbi:MAG: hypothetical protein HOP29_04510 [Phycisphaerales bacterium]|nr:hypothetical protein [Phycisphaerales bacterium]
MTAIRRRKSRACHPYTGFSLVELLVVFSILSLLAGVLLPSLRGAREQAKIVACASNTAAIGRGAAAYSAEWNGWMCGSPGTSGSVMYRKPRPAPEDEEIDTIPMQIWDWAAPVAAHSWKNSMPTNRAERMKPLLEDMFRCPSNSFEADPYPRKMGKFDRQRMVSYNTMRNFLSWTRTSVARNSSKPWGEKAPHHEASFDRIGGNTLPPKNYVPRMDRIERPAMKAYLADGNRYTDIGGELTYDLEWDAIAGGAFANGGPTIRETNGKLVLSAYHYDKELGKYAYRHKSKGERGIVVNYYDGHSAFMTETESRHPDTWWPTGTIIPAEDFNDPSRAAIKDRINADGNYVVGR